ncbi:MAG: DUF475 domain-containing protein [Burkholderiaceae bacterium]
MLVVLACLGIAALWGYSGGGLQGAWSATGLAGILGVMEISLSFDNAVVNAAVLKTWTRFWQNLFLGIGIPVAVFGMRLLLPVVIVSTAADITIEDVWAMALHHPARYAAHLSRHHAEISAFGGLFLLLVFLGFFCDPHKTRHWLGIGEAKLALLGRFRVVPVLLATVVALASVTVVEPPQQLAVLNAAGWGILTYVAVDVTTRRLEKRQYAGTDVGKIVKRGGVGAFLYLEILDASFSLDGVIAAFAITNDVIIIMLGLAIGAMFVRSLTIFLVRWGTLDEFIYLEHGAHYAIGVLALIMLASAKYHVNEIVTGLTGVALVGASFWSSLRYRRRQARRLLAVKVA